jgi:GNAT superfamily N-acetyltransferase
VFPAGPEREFYNNAVLDRATDAGRPSAVGAMERAYATAGIDRFAAWVHETDAATRADLVSRGYTLEETTRAMGMSLDDLADVTPVDPAIDIGPIPWSEYLKYQRTLGLAPGLLSGTDPQAFHALGASRSGTIVATGLAFHHERDCGVFNVSTLETARRQGIGTALTGRLLLEARDRGCVTATLQSTPMAERIYAAVGFGDLGGILEFQPARE